MVPANRLRRPRPSRHRVEMAIERAHSPAIDFRMCAWHRSARARCGRSRIIGGFLHARPLARWLALLASSLWAACASAQTVLPDLWGTDWAVTSVARVGNTLYIAGIFDRIGLSPGGGVPLDPLSGALRRPFPRVAGVVRAVVADGSGGWFIGGDFAAIEGQPRANLAHLTASGGLAAWNPIVEDAAFPLKPADPNPVGTVAALALHGNTLYVGGRFTRIGGQARGHVAAVDARTGAILPFDPAPNGAVTALAIRGNTLYVGGGYDHIAGVERHAVAALELPSGRVTPWDPRADGSVRAIAWLGRTVFVGGEFDHVGGAARNSIAALDMVTGRASAWDAGLLPVRQWLPHGDRIWPIVSSLIVSGNTLYVAGDFVSIGGRAQSVVAALDAGTGAATPFDARAGGGIGHALALAGHTLYVGGAFASIADSSRPSAAALDARTGAPTPWDPRVYGAVHALATEDGAVFAGGDMQFVHEWRLQTHLAALDLATGRPRDWSPAADGRRISGMLAIGNTLYIAGDFTTVNGRQRGHLAAFDGITGELTDWNPWDQQVTPAEISSFSTHPIDRLAAIGDTLFVCGDFEQIDGTPRRDIAAIDAQSGAVLGWDAHAFPSDQGWIWVMAPRGDTLFVGGYFLGFGMSRSHNLAALDAKTGVAFPWAPAPPTGTSSGDLHLLYAIAPTERGVYVGGWFLKAAGDWRIGLAAFDAAGALLPFDARMDMDPIYGWATGWWPATRTLLPWDDVLVVGGRFDQIGGRRVRNLALLDPATGDARDWNPDAILHPNYMSEEGVEALARAGDTLYVGGGFRRLGGYPCAGIAAVLMPRAQARPAEALAAALSPAPAFALEQPAPNPARAGTKVRFTLPAAATATFEVFDLQGRRVATPLDHAALDPGPHVVAIETGGWAPGVYCCRLASAGQMATRKLLVLR